MSKVIDNLIDLINVMHSGYQYTSSPGAIVGILQQDDSINTNDDSAATAETDYYSSHYLCVSTNHNPPSHLLSLYEQNLHPHLSMLFSLIQTFNQFGEQHQLNNTVFKIAVVPLNANNINNTDSDSETNSEHLPGLCCSSDISEEL